MTERLFTDVEGDLVLLERDAELAVLATAIAGLRDGRSGGVVLIEGPPGIGKSSLLAAALDAARDVRRCCAPAAPSSRRASTFGAVRRAARRRRCAGSRPPSATHCSTARAGSPRACSATPTTPPAQDGLGDPLLRPALAVRRAGRADAVVVAIDDLHWLDEESGPLRHLPRPRLEGAPLLLLATARPRRSRDTPASRSRRSQSLGGCSAGRRSASTPSARWCPSTTLRRPITPAVVIRCWRSS